MSTSEAQQIALKNCSEINVEAYFRGSPIGHKQLSVVERKLFCRETDGCVALRREKSTFRCTLMSAFGRIEYKNYSSGFCPPGEHILFNLNQNWPYSNKLSWYKRLGLNSHCFAISQLICCKLCILTGKVY